MKKLNMILLHCIHTCKNTANIQLDIEKVLDGTWVTVEIEKVIEKGYKIKRIHEIFTNAFRSKKRTSRILKNHAFNFGGVCIYFHLFR